MATMAVLAPLRAPVASPSSGVSQLAAIFPDLEHDILHTLLDAAGGNVPRAVTMLLEDGSANADALDGALLEDIAADAASAAVAQSLQAEMDREAAVSAQEQWTREEVARRANHQPLATRAAAAAAISAAGAS